MNKTSVPPAFKRPRFNCPHCDAFAAMDWHELRSDIYRYTPISMAVCQSCNEVSLWHSPGELETDPFANIQWPDTGTLLFPLRISSAPAPHESMPGDVIKDYEEARQVFSVSHRSAAALLRLALQKLCEGLVGRSGTINDLIGELVTKGMPVQIQRALDAIRIIGNSAVHPGQLNVDDKPEMIMPLFGLVNLIVETQIAQPAAIEEMYSSLPEEALAAVARRDTKKK
ncbi:DUF4145 domain-containing protein [Pseudomonas prosekii]|uniref:DUF4145 domain-containing protein n=1 Tax=Pseudomonas prosekii TaxID=1148509 RepID=UPI00387B8A15